MKWYKKTSRDTEVLTVEKKIPHALQTLMHRLETGGEGGFGGRGARAGGRGTGGAGVSGAGGRPCCAPVRTLS